MGVRDADATRQHLLEAARRRFARDGYAASTVRDIAGDAGVNVALINRYFTSKEGLFEACIAIAGEQLRRPEKGAATIETLVSSLVRQVSDSANGEQALQLLLLLRSSGDDRTDRIRASTLQSFAERMAAIGGWTADDDDSRTGLLRAQLILCTALGIVLLRSSTQLEPLASAGEEELTPPVGDVIAALLRSA